MGNVEILLVNRKIILIKSVFDWKDRTTSI